MKPIKLVVAALALAAPVAVPAMASATASPSHFVLREQTIFTEFYWKADPTTTCGPEAHVVGFGGFESAQSGTGAPTRIPLAAVFIEYFDRCTGAYESTSGSSEQANLAFHGLTGTETATVYPLICGVDGCQPDLSNPIGLNLSVHGTDTTHDNLAGHGHGTNFLFTFTVTGVTHAGPVSGSVTFTTSSGQVLTVFPNYTDPAQPLITGNGMGGLVGSNNQTDIFVSFN